MTMCSIWVSNALDGTNDPDVVGSLVATLSDDPTYKAMVAPWNDRISKEVPPGGIVDTDWGIATTESASLRWRRDSDRLGYVLVSTVEGGFLDAQKIEVRDAGRTSYIVDARYAHTIGYGKVDAHRYGDIINGWIVRYRLVEESRP